MHLSPIQLHYLKKELIKLELNREWDYLQETCPDLIYLSSIPQQQQQTTTQDLPFIRFIIHHLIQPFPLLQYQTEQQQSAFWSQWQLFLTEWYQRLPSTWMPPEAQETLERRAMMVKVKKMISLLLEKLIKCDIEEASYNLSTASDDYSMHQLDIDLTTSRPPTTSPPRDFTNGTNNTSMTMHGINIVSAQLLDEQNHRRRFHRLLTNSTKTQHTYFIIETKDNNSDTLHYAPRRHCDFRRLAKQLRSQFPERKDIPSVPAKIRTNNNNNNSKDGLPWCEMDRRRLRTFLHRVTSIPALRQSNTFQEFLSSTRPDNISSKSDDDDDGDGTYEKKTTTAALWNKEEHLDTNDVTIRQQLDAAFLLDQQQYSQHIDDTLSSLDQELKQIKHLLFQSGGCTYLLNVIKTTENWQDLPSDFKKGFEWGQLCFAFTLHKQLVVSDLALENRNQLRKTHNFMPYRTLSTLMKIYNPMYMVKAMLNLFLATPFGSQSLMQRTILINLQEEMNSLQKDIKALEKTMDSMICDKLYNAVTTKRTDTDDELQGLSPANALLYVLKHTDIEPILSPSQLQCINFTTTTAATQQHNDTIHWKDAQRLWHLYAKREDHTKWMDILLLPATGTLLQSVMEILYHPLAQVYQAADLSTTLYELKDFIDDLIRVMDDIQLDHHQQQQQVHHQTSLDTIQPFIDLVQRHQHAFYRFVHNVHTQTESKLFTDLISYIDTWLARTYTSPITTYNNKTSDDDSSSSTPTQQQQQRWNIEAFWAEVNLDKDQEQALNKELDLICEYHRARKSHMFEKRRLRMEKMVAMGQSQQQDDEAMQLWSDDDDSDLDDNDDDDNNNNNHQAQHRNRIIPPTFPSSSVLSSLLLPTFINQISPLLFE